MKACLDQRHTFVALAYSVDSMTGVEVHASEKRIASLLAAKWGREYSELLAFVRAKMAMTVVKANTLLLRDARLKRPKLIICVNGTALEGFHGLCEL